MDREVAATLNAEGLQTADSDSIRPGIPT
jgi:hypothetical protein